MMIAIIGITIIAIKFITPKTKFITSATVIYRISLCFIFNCTIKIA